MLPGSCGGLRRVQRFLLLLFTFGAGYAILKNSRNRLCPTFSRKVLLTVLDDRIQQHTGSSGGFKAGQDGRSC